MVDFEPLPRLRGERFRRYAAAMTQAEIRRLSRAQRLARAPRHDTMATVQHELRRLSHPDLTDTEGGSRTTAG